MLDNKVSYLKRADFGNLIIEKNFEVKLVFLPVVAWVGKHREDLAVPHFGRDSPLAILRVHQHRGVQEDLLALGSLAYQEGSLAFQE